jgi:hypothetical protein
MMSAPLMRRLALGAGATALIGMGMLTACGTKEKPVDNSPPSSDQTATATVSPTEKGMPGVITPGANGGPGGPNSYSPTAKARPAPTALPGNVITGG